jgi:hypothetical protein
MRGDPNERCLSRHSRSDGSAANHPRGVGRSVRNRLRLSDVCGFGFDLPRSVEFRARWSYRGTVEVVLDDMLKVKDVRSAKSLRSHMLEAKEKSAEPEE